MKTIITVFKKEMLDTIRDRRTIMMMIVIPLLLFPVIFKVMSVVEKSVSDKAKAKTLRIAASTNGNSDRFLEIIGGEETVVVVAGVHPDSIKSYIAADSLDGGFVMSSDFDDNITNNKPGRIDFYYKATGEKIVRDRLQDIADKYEEELLDARFERLDLNREVVDGIDLRSHNIASMKEKFGKQIGGFLPYIFILFCFMGAMYPAIDLGAGEKERGTMETLLTAPVNRYHVLMGKLGVIVVSGIMSAAVSIGGLYIGVRQVGDLPPEIMETVIKILGVDTVILVISLLLPLTIFFGGILLSISLMARGFKEAQSMVSPLNIAVIVPAVIGTIPGIELTFVTALIPVLNVSLATKEIIAGTATVPLLITVYATLIGLALAAMAVAAKQFNRESVIFRT
jgi:sodium transport system permease protein